MQESINNQSMLKVGTILHGTYRIDSYLSSGGFGNTYVATNIEFDERVAIKEFFMKGVTQRDDNQTTVSVSNTENHNSFLEQKEKFKKEARRIRQLKNEHIIAVHDLFEENGTAYYVMDFVDGENLSERLKHTGEPMSENEVRDILPQILDALKSVHDAGIWHLDLKPANIMLTKEGKVKLIDFGASKQLDAQKGGATTSTAISYTNGYAPREQMEQNYDKFGPWTDIYALGATLYNLLTNKRPPLPTDIDDDISEDKHNALPFPENVGDLRFLVLQMMKTNRLQRPQNIDAIDIGTKQEQSPASGSRCSQDSHWVKSPWSTDEEGEETVIDNSRYIQKNKSQIGSNSKEKLTQSACGIIFVQCSSGKASVVIDHKYCGMTPLKTSVNEGTHIVNIIKDKITRTHNVTVWAGQTIEVNSFFPLNNDQSAIKKPSSFLHNTFFNNYNLARCILSLFSLVVFWWLRFGVGKILGIEIFSSVPIGEFGYIYGLLFLYGKIRKKLSIVDNVAKESLIYAILILTAFILVPYLFGEIGKWVYSSFGYMMIDLLEIISFGITIIATIGGIRDIIFNAVRSMRWKLYPTLLLLTLFLFLLVIHNTNIGSDSVMDVFLILIAIFLLSLVFGLMLLGFVISFLPKKEIPDPIFSWLYSSIYLLFFYCYFAYGIKLL